MEASIDDMIFEAVHRGDLDTIRNILHQPAVVASVADMNHEYRYAYTSALRAKETPFFAFRYTPRSDRCWLKTVLFNLPTKQEESHVFEWFLGVEADGIMGDSVRSLLDPLFCQVLWSGVSLQLTETILTSHLYLSMSVMEREFALSMMLHGAIQKTSPALVRLLVAHGASLVNATNLIAWCVKDGGGSMAQLLVNCGVPAVGQQMRVESSFNRTSDAAKVLLAYGADVQANQDEFGSLHEVANDSSTEFVELLVVQGFADVNAQDSRGMTPLMSASGGYETFLVVSFLLDHGALVNLRDGRNRTALHYAVSRANSRVVPLLLEKGADPNAQDTSLETPLHFMAELVEHYHYGDFSVALDALLSRGADPNIRSIDGDTPLDLLLKSERGREYVKHHPGYFADHHEAAGLME